MYFIAGINASFATERVASSTNMYLLCSFPELHILLTLSILNTENRGNLNNRGCFEYKEKRYNCALE
jgi:hypothetical protein